jgi:sugar/nucleoside kinase (ribokinase family)
MMAGRVIHTGQAVVDFVLHIDHLPQPGGDIFASESGFSAGGGFNVMAAAARDGAEVVYAGTYGSGPLGQIVQKALSDEGIHVLQRPIEDMDSGISIALIEPNAERTFVSTAGAETHASTQGYQIAGPQPGDVVYVSGYSLAHRDNRTALLGWLPTLSPDITVITDPSPIIGDFELSDVRAVAVCTTIWSTNDREARLLLERLDRGPESDDPAEVARALSEALQCVVVLRRGSSPTIVAQDGTVFEVPGLKVEAVDTNGAGDAHCGVLAAALASGEDLRHAVRRANIAAAIAVTRPGPATSPVSDEINQALAD